MITEKIMCTEFSNEDLTKEIVFEKLFKSSNYGNLGLFIGAGFSKAIVESALNWFELIKSTSEKLKLDFPQDEDLVGVSLPELSSRLCKELQNKYDVDYFEAKSKFKEKICDISNWLPSEEKIDVFKEIFDIIEPNWIITTNYDLVLETILTGKCKSLSSHNYLSAPKGVIPIYHIHGTRLDNDKIIVTQDDYIPLFRPNEYRQSKLAMTIRESTTLVMGYGLSDMNILSALDWSKNIYTEKNEYPYEIIQVIWTSGPKENPYKDENGNIIIEVNDLEVFLKELCEYLIFKNNEHDNKLKELDQIISKLNDCDDDKLIQKFINEKEFRVKLLNMASEYEYSMIYSYINFFYRCIDEVWKETSKDGAFNEYNKYLVITLDIIINYEYKIMPPRLFQIIAEALNNVFRCIGDDPNKYVLGDSWDATKTWHREKRNIPTDMVRQLYTYSKENSLHQLKWGLKELIEYHKIDC